MMFSVQKLILAALLVLTINICQVVCHNRKNSPLIHKFQPDKCVDKYSTFEKQQKLNEYILFIEKLKDSRSLMAVNDILSMDAESNSRLFDETQCLLRSRNTFTVRQRSLCPWKYDVKFREDRFPEFIAEAKCTCSKCNHMIKDQLPNTYGCLPILEPRPVLKRSCGSDGIYTWTPDIEFINVGCTCAFKVDFNL